MSTHSHDHGDNDHLHVHPPLKAAAIDEYSLSELAIRELLMERGFITEALRRKYLDQIESKTQMPDAPTTDSAKA